MEIESTPLESPGPKSSSAARLTAIQGQIDDKRSALQKVTDLIAGLDEATVSLSREAGLLEKAETTTKAEAAQARHLATVALEKTQSLISRQREQQVKLQKELDGLKAVLQQARARHAAEVRANDASRLKTNSAAQDELRILRQQITEALDVAH